MFQLDYKFEVLRNDNLWTKTLTLKGAQSEIRHAKKQHKDWHSGEKCIDKWEIRRIKQ